MKLERENLGGDPNQFGRRIIQVDVPPVQAGIMAALRRAFEEAASEPCNRDFMDLLRKLN